MNWEDLVILEKNLQLSPEVQVGRKRSLWDTNVHYFYKHWISPSKYTRGCWEGLSGM